MAGRKQPDGVRVAWATDKLAQAAKRLGFDVAHTDVSQGGPFGTEVDLRLRWPAPASSNECGEKVPCDEGDCDEQPACCEHGS